MKKFSIVTIFGDSVDEDEEIFLPGFCEIEDLSCSSVFFEIMSEVPSTEIKDIEIEHCYLLEHPFTGTELEGKAYARDIFDVDMDDLLDNFDKYADEDRIFCEETIDFNLEGLNTNEVYVEEVISFEDNQ